MAANPYVNKYEWLQVLLAVLLVVVHLTFCLMMVPGPVLTLPGIAIGVLEIAMSSKMSSRLTFRATEPPLSVGSAMGGLRPWLVGVGILTATFSAAYLASTIVVARYY